nr:hypothetical protein [Halomonas sp. UBA3074]
MTPTNPMVIGQVFNRPGDGKASAAVFNVDDLLKRLPAIEKTIRAIPLRPVNTRVLEDDFASVPLRLGLSRQHPLWRVKEHSRFYQYRFDLETLMELDHRRCDLSLHARAFLKHLRWSGMAPYNRRDLRLPKKEAQKISQQFQQSLDKLIQEITSSSFKRRVKEADTAAKTRASSLTTWMRAAFRQAPRLLWVQVQLGYNTQHYDNLSQTLTDRETFLKNRQGNPLFRFLVGYVGKLHYHPTKGLMHDMIFLYDARYVQEGVSLGKTLATRWEKTTSQLGIAWIEGEPIFPSIPRINGFWSLETQEDTQRLQQLIRYLSHYDTYLHYETPPHTRTLVKSQIPGKLRNNKRSKKGD